MYRYILPGHLISVQVCCIAVIIAVIIAIEDLSYLL